MAKRITRKRPKKLRKKLGKSFHKKRFQAWIERILVHIQKEIDLKRE